MIHTSFTSRLTVERLCFSMWLAIYTSTTDFHRLAKRHACRTIIIPQYNWGIFISAYKALILVGTEVPQFDSLRHFRLRFCYLLPFERVFIFFYCHLVCHHIFFKLIFYVIIYCRLVISYCTYIEPPTPKCSISIFIF